MAVIERPFSWLRIKPAVLEYSTEIIRCRFSMMAVCSLCGGLLHKMLTTTEVARVSFVSYTGGEGGTMCALSAMSIICAESEPGAAIRHKRWKYIIGAIIDMTEWSLGLWVTYGQKVSRSYKVSVSAIVVMSTNVSELRVRYCRKYLNTRELFHAIGINLGPAEKSL